MYPNNHMYNYNISFCAIDICNQDFVFRFYFLVGRLVICLSLFPFQTV